MWTWLFWKAALERALKTGAQALLGAFAGDVVGFVHAPWGTALDLAAMMMVLSVLFSIGSGFVPGDPWTSPSAVRTVPQWASGVHRRPESIIAMPRQNRRTALHIRKMMEKALRDKQKAGTEPATVGTDDPRA